uniref:Uncharacterized protein n=1 Tax=Acrobeloides nanus TaxID=290746 RepID=A0A914CK65_9BILA
MHSFGHKQQEIADALHISQQLVSKAIIRGTVEDRPGHRAKETQAWLRENVPDFISNKEWPPYSPTPF